MSLKRNNQVDFTVLLIVLPLIFLLIGVVFLSVAIGVGVYDRNKQDRCSETTKAQVVDIAVKRGDDGGLLYAPVFGYAVDGQEYINQQSIYSNPCGYSVGEDVELSYNPNDPQEFYVEGDSALNLLIYIFGGIGAVFLVTGIIVLIVLLKIRKKAKEQAASQWNYNDNSYWTYNDINKE